MYISMKEAQSLLPKVGDVRIETPSRMQGEPAYPPQECTVVEVHPAQLWYRVRFKDSGYYECYKVPELNLGAWGGIRS